MAVITQEQIDALNAILDGPLPSWQQAGRKLHSFVVTQVVWATNSVQADNIDYADWKADIAATYNALRTDHETKYQALKDAIAAL